MTLRNRTPGRLFGALVGQSASALVIYERGHVSAGEILRFGFWMTLVAYVAIVCVALPY